MSWNQEFFFLMVWIGLRTELLIFDHSFRRVGTVRPPGPKHSVIAPHQIIWLEDRLWIANTQYDYFTIWNPKDDTWDTWRPADEEVYRWKDNRGNDVHHINGCWLQDGKLYVVAHNKAVPSWIQEHSWPDLKRLNRFEANGRRIHNIWNENGTFAVCSSEEGCVKNVKGKILANTGGFPRGVVITNGLRVIGVSAHHFKCKSRETVDGCIHVYNKDWTMQKLLFLDGFGQIYELRGLQMKDQSHYPGCEQTDFNLEDLQWKQSNQMQAQRLQLI
jgi:hypothetical protein